MEKPKLEVEFADGSRTILIHTDGCAGWLRIEHGQLEELVKMLVDAKAELERRGQWQS